MNMKQVPSNGNKSTALFGCLGIFLVLLYAWSSPSGTTPEDASEFILTAHFLGVPHPPGYPLFVWLGHLFSYLPLGTPAEKIAFLSHLSIAGSAVIWGLWAFFLFNNLLLASWVSLTFGLSLPIWSSGQFVEVYPLHTFLLTLTFFEAFRLGQFEEKRLPSRVLFLFGLSLGLALANHYPLVVLSLPAFLALLYPVGNKLLNRASLGWMAAGLFAGLIPYLYLFIAHSYSEFIFSSEIRSASDFFDYVTRKEYAANDRSKVFSVREVGLYGWLGIQQLFWAFTPLVFISALLGARRFFKKAHGTNLPTALILGTLSSYLFLFLFWQPDYYRLAIELYETFHGFALGCFLLFSCGALWHAFLKKRKQESVLYLLFLIPFFLLVMNFKAADRRTDSFAEDYASLVLDSLPEKTLLLVKGDADAGILAYAHFLENKRPDIKLISQVAALLPNKPFDRKTDIQDHQHQIALLNLISTHLSAKHPVFSIGPVEYFSPQTSPFPLKIKNYGLFREIYEADPAPARDFSQLAAQEAAFLDKSLSESFEPNFKHYRDRIISDVCHGLLVAEKEHRAFSEVPRCQLLKAQWLHVEKKDYEGADKLFLNAIQGSALAQNSELAEMAKDFVLNRIQILESHPGKSSPVRRQILEDTFKVALPVALDFKTCKNTLAPKLLQLAVLNGLDQEANAIRSQFSDCRF